MFLSNRNGFCVIAYLLFWVCGGCHQIKPTKHAEYIRPELKQDWQAVIEQNQRTISEAMDDEDIPGLSIAVLDREGLIWSAGFGYTDYDLVTPITPDTIFGIQSMSKNLTATLVLLCVQEGLLDLDVPIVEYLPEFTVKSRFEQNPEKKITLRHLLNHTSGLIHEAPVGNNIETECSSFKEHIGSISQTWLKFPVGARYSYSNLGVDLAAYIVQERSNRPFADVMNEKLFLPLGMSNSSADMDYIETREDRAFGHAYGIENMPVRIPMLGAGGVYTSANDLSKYIQFQLNFGAVNGRSLLDRTAVESMSTSSPGLCIDVYLHEVSLERYPSVEKETTDTYSLFHGGGGFGFLAQMRWFPEYGIGLIALTNDADHNFRHSILLDLLMDDLIAANLIHKQNMDPNLEAAWKQNFADRKKRNENTQPVISEFTPYNPKWKQYEGKYRPMTNYILSGLNRIGDALGASAFRVKIYEDDGYLKIDGFQGTDGEKLDEYQPGVFFTKDGDCLDFTGPLPLWKGLRLEKR